MDTPVNLVIMPGDRLWPVIQAVVHWNGPAGTRVSRLCLYAADEAGGSRDVARSLARWTRAEFPETKVEVREGGLEPAQVRRQLEAWHRQAPSASWILVVGEVPPPVSRVATGWIGRPGCRVVHRDGGGVWWEMTVEGEGEAETALMPEIRRDATDGVAVDRLVQACLPETGAEPAGAGLSEETLAMVPLTEAAIAASWDWGAAFAAAGLDDSGERPGALFGRYVAGLLRALGIRGVVRRDSPAGTQELWVNRAGRLVVFDLGLEGEGKDEDTGTRGVADLARLSERRRTCRGGAADWVMVRPALTLSEPVLALARAQGIRVVDEAACRELPSRLAAIVDLPLSAEGAEVERSLTLHLAATGRVRVFAAESEALQWQTAAGADPAILRVDGWLDRVRRDRRQNWLLWTHAGQLQVRLPAGGRSSAAADWGLLLVGLTGLPAERLQIQPAPDDPRSLIVRMPDQREAREAIRDWLQPFLNRAMTYEEARERFAAKARVSQEAGQAAGPVRPAPAARPTPGPAVVRGDRPRPERRPSGPAKPRQNPLADLDRALDEALGGGGS